MTPETAATLTPGRSLEHDETEESAEFCGISALNPDVIHIDRGDGEGVVASHCSRWTPVY